MCLIQPKKWRQLKVLHKGKLALKRKVNRSFIASRLWMARNKYTKLLNWGLNWHGFKDILTHFERLPMVYALMA